MGLLLLLLTARQGLTAVDRDDDDLSAVVAAPREESCCCNAPEEKAPMIDEWEGDVASSLHGVRRMEGSGIRLALNVAEVVVVAPDNDDRNSWWHIWSIF